MTDMRLMRATIAAAAAIALVLAGCGGGETDFSGGGGGGEKSAGGSIAADYDLKGASLTVGSKEFTENRVLGQIAIAALQAAGAEAKDKTGISGTDSVRAALTSGEIDLYWEYTGTGWANILKNSTEKLPEDLFAAVSEADAKNDVSWIGPAPFNNTYAIAVKSSFAKENSIQTLSDAAAYAKANPGDATLCAAAEFLNRDDGLPGLEAAYEMKFKIVELDLNLVYTQVGKNCKFGEVTSTEARIAENDLFVLEDDKQFFVPYHGALTVKTETFDKYADIKPMFEAIMADLTDEKMVELNGKVDIGGEDEADVATAYLREKGFID